jgi:hypothetical protein
MGHSVSSVLSPVKLSSASSASTCQGPSGQRHACQADKLETYKLHEYGSMKPIVLFNPMSVIQLNINGQTVTRQIHAAIHQQQYFVPIKNYYRSRFHWPQDTFDNIDWQNFALAYKRFPRQHTFFYKLGWRKLLVAA